MVKPVFRRKSIGTKVSEEEYAKLEALAGGRAMSEWVREVLLRELDGGQATSGSCSDASPMHFTGKMRDAETNLDDFDARYYSSQWGRFISADWSAVPAPVRKRVFF